MVLCLFGDRHEVEQGVSELVQHGGLPFDGRARRLWASYNGDIGNLDAKINELVRYQAELVEKRRVETEQGERRTQIMWMLIALLAVVTIVVVIAVMAKRAPR